jgi:hypothetical protein
MSSDAEKKLERNKLAMEVGIGLMVATILYVLFTGHQPLRLLLCGALSCVLVWYYLKVQK